MISVALGSILIGLAVAYGGTRWLSERLPARLTVLATGAVSALVGGMITYTVMGDGHPIASMFGALTVGAALLSLLIRPGGRQVGRSAAV